jgi:signal transduction histidine kinase
VLVQGVCALALVACTRVWSTPILVIIVIAQAAAIWSPRALALWMLVSNLVLYAIIAKLQWDVNAALSVVMQVGFQSFAVLMTRFATSAEQRAEELRAINAELVATRSLLAEGVRDQERLRLSRELHDVAGHKLTALKLNLRALQQQAPDDLVDEVAQCTQLADELLGDLRGVVRQMRSDDGIDLGRALNSLAAPFRRPRVDIVLDPAVRVDSLELAQTIVRVVQEGITNAVRHAEAEQVTVTLRRDHDRLRLDIRDDGRARTPIRAGHGLTGMRERVDEHGGELVIDRDASGTTLHVVLPA